VWYEHAGEEARKKSGPDTTNVPMIFTETKLRGAYVIEPQTLNDERGFFARTWSGEEFSAKGLNANLVQCNTSNNKLKGTVRGMHFQSPPHEEAKLIRCTAGALYDVIVDLRPDSPTWGQWFGIELTRQNLRMIYVPEGFAHGYQTLADDTDVFYQVSAYYHQESASGVRWDDPTIAIDWPLQISVISERDRKLPSVDPQEKK
jgi:dTDP-4-dehydrorhamnose 3,5-epimerase